MKQQINLGWGDPFVVRQALTETLGVVFSNSACLMSMGYTPHHGTPALIELLKDIAERQSGKRPKHLTVTCGANGAVSAALYALKNQRTDWVHTHKRYYPLYPAIINAADMIMVDRHKKDALITSGLKEENFISLIDSPSNPEGLVSPFTEVDIWDAAYASKCYSKGSHDPRKWKIMCGSLSKTLGLSGLRLGWASTDDDSLANSLDRYVTTTYAGLSAPSMEIAEYVLNKLNQDKFEERAFGYMNDNRTEMQKVLTKFGQGDVSPRGMFAIIELGKPERKALERGSIVWQPGNTWGEDDNWARLSLGQTREVIKEAVKRILK